MGPRECLILFTRYPQPGTTKTRLIPRLGPRGAADLQRQMTAKVMDEALPLKTSRGLELEVRYDGGSARLMAEWLGRAVRYGRQGDGDIGRRMASAFRQAFGRGRDKVVLVGSDIPGLSAALLEQAFDHLDDRTVVFGPAADGGYYLVGLVRRVFQRAEAALFEHMAWGTATVLAESCRRLARLNLDIDRLAQLADVDRPEDLPIWERSQQR
jgi:rSAM/selenodomain-associated transferase 1